MSVETDEDAAISNDRLVRVFIAMRDALARHTKDAKTEADRRKKEMRMVENELLHRAHASGSEGFKTKSGTTYIDVDLHISIADKAVFRNFVENDADPLGWFTQRVSMERFREFVKDTTDEESYPPGLNVFREQRMKVREKKRSKSKTKATDDEGDNDD